MTASLLAQAGASLYLSGTSGEKLLTVEEEIRGAGTPCQHMALDLTAEGEPARLVEAAAGPLNDAKYQSDVSLGNQVSSIHCSPVGPFDGDCNVILSQQIFYAGLFPCQTFLLVGYLSKTLGHIGDVVSPSYITAEGDYSVLFEEKYDAARITGQSLDNILLQICCSRGCESYPWCRRLLESGIGYHRNIPFHYGIRRRIGRMNM